MTESYVSHSFAMHEKKAIMKTRLYYIGSYTPFLYNKTGIYRVHIIFLISA